MTNQKSLVPILQFIAGVSLLFGGIKEYGRLSDDWSIGLIALGALLLTISGVRLSFSAGNQ